MKLPNTARIAFVMALAGAPFLSGCRLFLPLLGANAPAPAAPQPAAPQPAAPKPAVSPWQVQARAAKTRVKRGEPLRLQISVRNASQKPATLQFSSGQSVEFQATRVGETEVFWTWSADKMFVQALRQETFTPNEITVWQAQWDAPPPGTYRITGSVTADPKLGAPPFEVVVE